MPPLVFVAIVVSIANLRQVANAARLGLVHPATRSRLELSAPLPAELRAVLEALGLRGVD